MSHTGDLLRAEFERNIRVRDAGLETPADIYRRDDLVYGSDPRQQNLDIYRPRATRGRLPVLISVHGGAWVFGRKEHYQYYCMSLAQRGFAVVNFSYRLAPENRFPAPLEDLCLLMDWVRENADRYEMDPEHVFAAGDSAGAHLLALYACLGGNPDYAARFPFRSPGDLKLSAVALNCGAYTIAGKPDRGAARVLLPKLMAEFLPPEGEYAAPELASVLPWITPSFPPAFLMTCSGDFLQDQTRLMADSLLKNEVPFVSRFFRGEGRRLPHVFHCDLRLPEAAQCNDEECAFFQRFLQK